MSEALTAFLLPGDAPELVICGAVLSAGVTFHLLALMCRRLWHQRQRRVTRAAHIVVRNELCALVPVMLARLATSQPHHHTHAALSASDDVPSPSESPVRLLSRQTSTLNFNTVSGSTQALMLAALGRHHPAAPSSTTHHLMPPPSSLGDGTTMYSCPPSPVSCAHHRRATVPNCGGGGERVDASSSEPLLHSPPLLLAMAAVRSHTTLISEVRLMADFLQTALLVEAEVDALCQRATVALQRRYWFWDAEAARSAVLRSFHSLYEAHRLALLRDYLRFVVAFRSGGL